MHANHHKTHFLLTAAIVVMCTYCGCKKENPSGGSGNYSPGVWMPVMTGFVERDAYGNTYEVVGKPNIHLTDSIDSVRYFLNATSMPNVVSYNQDTAYITIYGQFSSSIPHIHVTLEKAIFDSTSAGGSSYNPRQIISQQDLNDKTSFYFELNTRQMEPGYYRTTVTAGKVTLWDNLVINKVVH